jgi:hypothetical protein
MSSDITIVTKSHCNMNCLDEKLLFLSALGYSS